MNRAILRAAVLRALAALAALTPCVAYAEDAVPPRRHGEPPPAGMGDPPAPAPPAEPAPTPPANPPNPPSNPTPPATGTAKPPPPLTDWSTHMGKLKFVVGFDAGLDQAWEAGRPAMLFFTSSKRASSRGFGRRVWSSEDVTDKLVMYLPVLVDAESELEAVRHFKVKETPTVVWVTFEGNEIYRIAGDTAPEDFEEYAENARQKAPQIRKPEADLELLARVREDLKTGLEKGNVKKALGAAFALAQMKRPQAARDEGEQALHDLDEKGMKRLTQATMARVDGKVAEAKAEFEKLAAEYRGRNVGKLALESLKERDADDGDK